VASIDGLVYLDASALVKRVVREPESSALLEHLVGRPRLITNQIAVVEVIRAVRIADPSGQAEAAARKMLAELALVELDLTLLEHAAVLGPRRLRTLDAMHLATALVVGPDELIAYDRRLLDAAAEAGLTVASPGA
jgi:predicted nucleic acid-binding protein